MKRATVVKDVNLLARKYVRPRGGEGGEVLCSIHALVKRATLYFKYFMLYNIISIHALVKRATLRIVFASGVASDFNPRPREEGDRL